MSTILFFVAIAVLSQLAYGQKCTLWENQGKCTSLDQWHKDLKCRVFGEGHLGKNKRESKSLSYWNCGAPPGYQPTSEQKKLTLETQAGLEAIEKNLVTVYPTLSSDKQLEMLKNSEKEIIKIGLKAWPLNFYVDPDVKCGLSGSKVEDQVECGNLVIGLETAICP